MSINAKTKNNMFTRIGSFKASTLLSYSIILVLLVGLITTVLLVKQTTNNRSSAAIESAQFLFIPSSAILPPDTSFKLMLDAKSNKVAFTRVSIRFDPNYIQLINEVDTSNSPLKTTVLKTSKAEANTTGNIILVLAQTPNTASPTGIFELAQLIFTTASSNISGSTTLSVLPQDMQLVSFDSLEIPYSYQTTAIIVNPNIACLTSSDTWQNKTFLSQTDSFTVKFDAKPDGIQNGVIGLSNSAATSYTNLAASVRFNTNGFNDARNGGAYSAVNKIPYSANVSYSFRMVVDITSHTYSAYVSPQGGSEVLIGSNFAFRTEQAGVTALNNLGMFTVSPNNTALCNFALILPIPTATPTPIPPTYTPTPTNTPISTVTPRPTNTLTT